VNARAAALRALLRGEDVTASLDATLKDAELDARDTGFATELAYGTTKMRRALEWSVQTALKRPFASLDAALQWILLLGAYQLLYLDRIPAHGAVDESVKLARAYGHAGTAGLANAVLRAIARERPKPKRPTKEDTIADFATFASLPDWIAEHYIARFGFNDALRAAEGLNAPPARAVRLAAGQSPPPDARPSPYGVPETALVESLTDEARAYAPQSAESQLAVHLLDPRPGETVLDICAGRGTKTAMIAQRLGGAGAIFSVDDDDAKLSVLRRDNRRWPNITAVAADARKPFAASIPRDVDRALVDAPCSGLGILGRRSDARWRKAPGDPDRFAAVQRMILAAAADRVRVGGTLLYVTCSTHEAEDEAPVQAFLAGNAQWRAVAIEQSKQLDVAASRRDGLRLRGPYLQIVPGIHGADGFYYALLERRSA
jgi:16S rRNA (cytosine967-C5)-methyltransferase